MRTTFLLKHRGAELYLGNFEVPNGAFVDIDQARQFVTEELATSHLNDRGLNCEVVKASVTISVEDSE